ncbi:MAG: hypothetical protein U1A24_18860 [Cypionkella sp.]|uniref:hypothetical protein n=1 Tax=Cypionkella sp. TaxID=2811411 RepID=UPI002ABB56D4|nr:hypothetical protein [Cypionkella sp.]MDZ4312615.1 hypothetical protein [Cypionkella sp.]
MFRLALATVMIAAPPMADPLSGKSYIVELSSTQSSSGYGEYLLPPLLKALQGSGLKAKSGPGADLVINIKPDSDVGRWVGAGENRVWLYTISATVGISPESYMIPFDGTPVFGITASLQTPNPDRQDEMDCLITLAARTALKNYRPTGVFKTDGSACARK